MPTGAGAASVGLSVAGYGGVDSAPVQQQTILIDAKTGIAQNSRKVDPSTGRYLLDSFGRVQGMPGVQQLVMLRAGTLFNSSAVLGLGMLAPSGVIGANILRRLEDEIRLCMKDIVDAGIIEIIGVTVIKPPGQPLRRAFQWKDLTTKNEQETAF